MTVIAIRCHECGEVKREKKIEIASKGNICDDCKRDIPDEVEEAANSGEVEVSEEEVAQETDDTEESTNTPTDSEEKDENAEGDKKPVEETFNEQDPLEW